MSTIGEAAQVFASLYNGEGGCGAAAVQAHKALLGDLLADMPDVGGAFTRGEHAGDRCALFEASVLTIGLLYGRETFDFSYQYDRELVGRLNDGYVERFGTCRCTYASEEECVSQCRAKLEILQGVLDGARAEGMEPWTRKKDGLLAKFGAHAFSRPYASFILDDADWDFIEHSADDGAIDEGRYTAHDIDRAYRRGVIDKVDDDGRISYRLGRFKSRIDCFMRADHGAWRALPEKAKEAFKREMRDFDIWVFPDLERGTYRKSTILPIERVLEKIDETENDIYVQDCDCRVYCEDACNRPIETCMHWPKNPINTPFDRGYARRLTKAEARENLLRSDRAGLVHSCAPNGDSCCNCCNDCCWELSQYPRLRERGYDPKESVVRCDYEIAVDEGLCVGCGACVKRCPFGALSVDDRKAVVDPKKCFGCGVCRAACRKGALSIREKALA